MCLVQWNSNPISLYFEIEVQVITLLGYHKAAVLHITRTLLSHPIYLPSCSEIISLWLDHLPSSDSKHLPSYWSTCKRFRYSLVIYIRCMILSLTACWLFQTVWLDILLLLLCSWSILHNNYKWYNTREKGKRHSIMKSRNMRQYGNLGKMSCLVAPVRSTFNSTIGNHVKWWHCHGGNNRCNWHHCIVRLLPILITPLIMEFGDHWTKVRHWLIQNGAIGPK